MRIVVFIALVLALLTPASLADVFPQSKPVVVRVLTGSFVLPEKFHAIEPLAAKAGVALEFVNVETANTPPDDWLTGVDMVILDVPRPSDRMRVEQILDDRLEKSAIASITIGGGQPRWHGIEADKAKALSGYYAAGGAQNFRNFFAAIRIWKDGGDLAEVPPVERRLAAGFWHPDAPHIFGTIDAYLDWNKSRGLNDEARVGFIISASTIGNMQTKPLLSLVRRAEAADLTPVVFWFDGSDPQALARIAKPAGFHAIVNLTHMQNGTARSAEFLDIDIPVIQTLGFREGGPAAWSKAMSGIPARTAAVFLAGPESWGMSDPLVLSAVENGAEVILPAQLDALMGKLKRLVALRRKKAPEKHLAILFWNYPAGEKNLAASNLNVPASIDNITAALAGARYDTSPLQEQEIIAAGQAMLGGLYRTVPLESLLERDLAVAFPVSDYQRWLNSLSPTKRHAFLHAGEPQKHWAVRQVNGVDSFIIPRLKRGKLVIMPQMPRGDRPGAHYHDMAAAPDHLYMAAYLYLREQERVDAIIHLGTHGTQEWLPGKDRGLSTEDEPFLAVGDVPVFYPYIQDNVGEALQAKRRGRAVTISHQTPPFAPSGLYDALRDIHHLIHDYGQLDEGAVRERTAKEIADAAISTHMHSDLGWTEEAVRADFNAFLAVLHDHLHELARTAMPLGLHRYGKAADSERRLATVMQQLGKPFYEAVGSGGDELFVDDFTKLKQTAPYVTLNQYLREGADRSTLNQSLQEMLQKADALDANLSAPNEIEALLAGLEGRFVAPGSGGDPIRNPEVKSGRNLYAFEPDKIPSKPAYEAGGKAFEQLVSAFREDNKGAFPQKIAFSLWSSEAIRHLGVTEAQILHALGLRPIWDEGGRIGELEIIPEQSLGRPRIDVVVQVTSVYRDQFDGFMRLLADAIERIAALDEKNNPVAINSARIALALQGKGLSHEEAQMQSRLRIFANAPGNYGTGLPHMTLASTRWENDSTLAEQFLSSTQFAYGAHQWGVVSKAGNLFATQLKGAQAAVMSRSSNLHGVLSTDHPFEFLGGLSLAIRHLDGKAPSLFISDLRHASNPQTTPLARFLSDELRTRYLNPHWIEGMKGEGYAGTLEMLNVANNLFGWQVTDPSTVRADQWQAMFDTYVADTRNLDMDAFFEAHNPTAQAQLMERMIEAIRKGYWDAPQETRQKLVERWQELASQHAVKVGEKATKDFIGQMAAGFGLVATPPPMDEPNAMDQSPDKGETSSAPATQTVSGQVLEEVQPSGKTDFDWQFWASLPFIAGLILLGAGIEWRANSARRNG